MEKKRGKKRNQRGIPLLLPIIFFFCILGAVVFFVSHKISREMSNSAIQNLSESLDLIQCTIESILNKEAEFQKLIAREAALAEDPAEYIRSYERNDTMVKLSLILAGEQTGVSNNGEPFTAEGLDFSMERTVEGLPISQSYVNYMGAWAYSMKCPVVRDGQTIGDLYVEYTYDSLDRSLPDGFYNKQAALYIMDAETQRFVLKPKGMGQRSAGHLNLEDFYRANSIEEEQLRAQVEDALQNGHNILFYHNIRNVKALNYMWSVNDGSVFLIGYVPLDAIQQEGRTVNQNIFIVIFVMLTTFLLCCMLYYFNQKQQDRVRREREAEREVYNSQLADALQAARIANNSKTTFLSNMSHDIRTPMNAVLGFTNLLAKEAENPVKVKEYTKKITASGQYLLSLINDILDVSKIESGKVVLNFEEFTLNDLVSSVDAIIQPMARAKNQNFHVLVTGVRHERLVGDETRMNQILINLLSNAVKYTQEGGDIWFRIIGLKQRSSQYEHIRIEVEDNGYGMTQEYLKTIFDAFTRAENSTTNKVQGTGLGMAITKNIVELMGGTIEVSSQVDKGSLFRVELECRIAEGQQDRQFWRQNGIQQMLVITADEETYWNIRELMDDVGVLADRAPEIGQGSVMMEGQQYQLVLLDWDLPGADSDQVAALNAVLPEEAALFLLASYEAEDQPGWPEGVAALVKPFFLSALKEKLLELKQGPEDRQEQQNQQTDSLEGLHFLAAEDNDINAEILAEVLEFEGASCEIVGNGKLALERFEQTPPSSFDAILMDVQMPVMNGYDATRAIRALSRPDASRIPIIAMTANAFVEDEKAALDAGMNAHVAKPLDVDLLKKVIRQYIGGIA